MNTQLTDKKNQQLRDTPPPQKHCPIGFLYGLVVSHRLDIIRHDQNHLHVSPRVANNYNSIIDLPNPEQMNLFERKVESFIEDLTQTFGNQSLAQPHTASSTESYSVMFFAALETDPQVDSKGNLDIQEKYRFTKIISSQHLQQLDCFVIKVILFMQGLEQTLGSQSPAQPPASSSSTPIPTPTLPTTTASKDPLTTTTSFDHQSPAQPPTSSSSTPIPTPTLPTTTASTPTPSTTNTSTKRQMGWNRYHRIELEFYALWIVGCILVIHLYHYIISRLRTS